MTGRTMPCSCPCGCTQDSGMRDVGSEVAARHARCEACATAEHAEQYPLIPPTGNVLARPITELYVPTDEEAELDAKIAEEQRRKAFNAGLARWEESLPEKFRGATSDHPGLLKRIERWKSGSPGTSSLLVNGYPGKGKTWLAVAYANLAIQEGLVAPDRVLFGTEATLLAAAGNERYGNVEEALRRLTSRKYQMLVIDDIGRGTWLSDEMRHKVYGLVLDAYWSDNRVIAATTNLTNENLANWLKEAAISRLRSMCGNEAVSLKKDTPDMRRQVTDEMMKAASSGGDAEDPFS